MGKRSSFHTVRQLLLLTVPVCICLAGCSNSATITRVDGVVVSGEIVRSDADTVFLVSEAGSESEVPRAEIHDIDHPGNAAALTGTIVGGFVLVGLGGGIAIIANNCNGQGDHCELGTTVTIVHAIATAGLAPLAIWGWLTWSRSRSAAQAPSEEQALGVSPFVTWDQRGQTVGAFFTLGW